MNKKNKILVGCLALLLALSVGYALFSETITINGTATAKGSFDISYTCKILDEYTEGGTGVCDTTTSGVIKTISTFKKPTDSVTYQVTITNNGTIPAKLKTVSSSNNADGDAQINAAKAIMYLDKTYMLYGAYEVDGVDMNYSEKYDTTVMNANIILQPGESKTIDVGHLWQDSDNVDEGTVQPAVPANGATMNYNITLGFEQVVAN